MAEIYDDIITNLTPKFHAGQKSGELYFFESTTVNLVENGKKFQVRVCPALLDKRKAKSEALAKAGKDHDSDDKQHTKPDGSKKSSPFEPPYVEDLHVGDLDGPDGGDGMAVLLNKFMVVPEHFLLTSQRFQPQHMPPTPPQLLLAYNLLVAASEHPTRPRRLMAFYNAGEGAGASQAWRHLQFMEVPMRSGAPVEGWVEGLKVERDDKPFYHPNLPYLHLLHKLPSASSTPWPPTEESNIKMMMALAGAMMRTLDLLFDARRAGDGKDDGWNMLLTTTHLHLIPRSSPSFPLPSPTDPKGTLEVNSLGYAGMMLVKSDDELKLVQEATKGHEEGKETTGLMRVLEHCGVPRQWGEGRDEEAEEAPLASL